MGFQLPDGAVGIGDGAGSADESKKKDEELATAAHERTLWEDIASLPGGIYAAATGEGIPIEFPNLPETTEMGDAAPGFFEAFMMNNKLMFARDDFGKAEIMEDTFGDDERWGGAFVDKFNNPMIVWNDKPYYVNKPGVSGQDIGTFIGEIIKFAPASKFVGGAKTVGGTIMRGMGAYSATELAGQAGEALLTPETTEAKKRDIGDVAGDVGVATGLGVAVDVLAPPVIKGTSKALRAGTSTVSETAAKVFPRFEPKNIQTSKYPLTVGQRTAPLPDRKAGPTEKVTPELEAEDVMRRAPGTSPVAANIIRGFDERQLDEIRTDAAALADEFGTGRPAITGAADVPTAVAEEIQATGVSAAASLKARAGKAYDVVQGSEFQPVMTRDGVLKTSQRALDSVLSPDGLGVTARELGDMPILNREIKYLKKINKLAQNPRFKGSPLNILHGYQKSLNRAMRTAEAGSPEALALGKIKTEVDQAVFDGIESGFMTGDQAVLDSLKEATDLYRQYIGLTGKATGKDAQEKAANRILTMITNENFTPKQVVNAFFGHAKFNPNQSMGLVLNKLKAALPEDQYSEVVALAKDAVLEKAFSGSGKSGVTRTNIVNNYDDVFVKNKAITGLLFSPDEISRISKFRDDVMPTLWAEVKLNPSNSGYTVLSGLARNGLLNYARIVPIVGRDAVDAIEGIKATGAAKDATRQYLRRTNMPLFTSALSISTRPTVVEEMGGEVSSPSLQSIIESAPPSVINKLNQSAPPQ